MPSIVPQLEEALEAGKASDYDRVEHCLRDVLQSIVVMRVEQHRSTRELDKAMTQAIALTHIFPQSPTGHVLQGDLWRERSCYARAVAAYERGLVIAPDNAALTQSIQEAKQHRDRKVDPVAALPNEVLARLFEFLPEKRVLCTRVSRVWRSRLLSITSLWRDLDVRLLDLPADGYWQRGLMQVLSPTLKTLRLCTNGTICPTLFMLREAGCARVEHIEIVDMSRYKPDVTSDGRRTFLHLQFVNDLKGLGHSLTTLHITTPTRSRGLLQVLLTLCPKLERLVLDLLDNQGPSLVPLDTRHLPRPQVTDLKYLEWSNMWNSNGVEEGEFLKKYCPSLEVVWIANYGSSAPIDGFMERVRRCPNLKKVTLGMYGPGEYYDDDVQDGIRSLVIDSSMPMRKNILYDLLTSSADTLQLFTFIGSTDPRAVRRIGDDGQVLPPYTMHGVQLKNLRRLALGYGAPDPVVPLSGFLPACSGLGNIQLVRMKLYPDTFRALIRMPHLHTLNIHYCSFYLPVLLRFFRDAAAQGAACSLRRLGFLANDISDGGDNQASMACLEIIAQIRSLTHLRLGFGRPIDANRLLAFAEHAEKSGLTDQLEYLDIVSENMQNPILQKYFANALRPFEPAELDDINDSFGTRFLKALIDA
ncbi:hypothetical protein BCR43DRAFT_499297 [Syncephalastrum racemosum]|uniref:F-box domain-containing protein n=1 Tax=Syncephalastrum racemosum TaxID=13706 RepID=A0A1X2H0C1_SYNRA|nr:hypothetical protein BCR43DRAFT_499297 [Syncephalastrum racemosum]